MYVYVCVWRKKLLLGDIERERGRLEKKKLKEKQVRGGGGRRNYL